MPFLVKVGLNILLSLKIINLFSILWIRHGDEIKAWVRRQPLPKITRSVVKDPFVQYVE